MKISKDLYQYSKGNTKKAVVTILFNQGFHSVLLYRLSYFFGKAKTLSVLGKIFMNLNRMLYGVEIDFRADFAPGLEIVHGNGIVVGGLVKSNGPVILFHGVTLGNGGVFGSKKREYNNELLQQPLLGSNVVVFPNSMILGPVVIEDNVMIGAGSIVTNDVSADNMVYSKVEQLTKKIV